MKENVFRKIVFLFIPIFLELLLVNLLSSVDTLMLTRYNELCVDAVGASNSTQASLTTLLIISSNGVSIVVGQFLGAGKNKESKLILAQGVFFNFCLGLLLMVIFFFGNGALLKMANTKEEFFEYAKSYMRIYSVALPFQAITQVINANFRAYGKPFYMTIVSILSNLINVLFNWLLIFGVGIFPELGIAGAAIATALSMMFKTFCGILLNHFILKCPLIPRKIDHRILGAIIKIGGPSALETVTYSLCAFSLTAALHTLPVEEVTSRVYINLVLGYIYMFSSALAASNSIMVARYVGSHHYQEAKTLTLKVTLVGLSIIIFLVSMINIFEEPLFTLIANGDAYNPIIKRVLPMVFILEIGRCVNLIVIGAQKSSGDVLFPLILAIVSMVIVMAGGAWIFAVVFKLNLSGIILAQGLDELVRGIISLIRWFSGKWMNKSLIKEEKKSLEEEKNSEEGVLEIYGKRKKLWCSFIQDSRWYKILFNRKDAVRPLLFS